jgi:HK97 family phage major capsid protein
MALNKSQIYARSQELCTEMDRLDDMFQARRLSKAAYKAKLAEIQNEAEHLDVADRTIRAAHKYRNSADQFSGARVAYGSEQSGLFGGGKSKAVTPPDGARQIARRDDPLDIDEQQLADMYYALKHGQPYRAVCKSFSDSAGFKTTGAPVTEGGVYPTGILPPTLRSDLFQEYRFPGAVTPVSAYLPTMAIDAPSIELPIQSTNTNPAATVSEAGVKSDIGVTLTKSTFVPVKIAALGSASTEILSDWPIFADWVPRLVANAVRDIEDQQILSGNGTAPNMTGLLNTSSTLTRVYNSTTDATPLDTILQGMDDIRQAPNVLGDPDLCLMHPYTFGAVRREKSSTGAFLLNILNPNEIGSLDNFWGVPVKTSVHVPQGQAIIMDSALACRYLVRQSLEIAANPWGDTEWTQNLVSFRAELRSVIAVIRPGAINLLTGLSQSSDLGS